MIFKNRSQLGSFGEYCYEQYCQKNSYNIERTNICHTDFILTDERIGISRYVDVKTKNGMSLKFKGKRYHEEISYELICVVNNEVILIPDDSSLLYNNEVIAIGNLTDLSGEWMSNSCVAQRQSKKISSNVVDELSKILSVKNIKRLRFVERGPASRGRWSGTVDNIPGSLNVIRNNEVIPPFCEGARSRDFKRPWPTAALV